MSFELNEVENKTVERSRKLIKNWYILKIIYLLCGLIIIASGFLMIFFKFGGLEKLKYTMSMVGVLIIGYVFQNWKGPKKDLLLIKLLDNFKKKYDM